MIFYDIEVFRYDWLMVLADFNNKSFETIINDREKLISFYDSHKNDIYIGFNNKKYDQYVFKGLLTGYDPFKISQYIIKDKKPGFRYSSDFNKIHMVNYDVYNTLTHGLKFYEGCLGDSVEESSIPFDINRKLTKDEILETEKYCRHDVEETIKLFFKLKSDFEAQLGLVKLSGVPTHMSRTQTQMAAIILKAEATDFDDKFDIDIPDTLKLSKYVDVKDWYLDSNNMDYEKSLIRNVAGVDHIFAWGGLHAAREKYHLKGKILGLDVASLYPSLILRYDLLSRAVSNPEIYRELRDKRLKLKAEHNPLQLSYKLILNKTYGAMKDRNNPLFDEKMCNSVCVHGQLLILDLIEHLEPYITLIQTNTDGIFIEYSDIEKIKSIAKEWEDRTGLTLEYTEATEIWQKDVNNYVLVLADGTLKTKGAYVKQPSQINDIDYPIVNKAIINRLVYNIPIKTTINNATDLIDFQMVCKITGKFSNIYYGNKKLNEKCVRIFAGGKDNPGISKQHAESLSLFKIPNTPENVIIDNSDIHGKKVTNKINKQFYIDLAEKRLSEFI